MSYHQRIRSVISALQLRASLTFGNPDYPGTVLTGETGSWLVHEDDKLFVLTDIEFRDIYESL